MAMKNKKSDGDEIKTERRKSRGRRLRAEDQGTGTILLVRGVRLHYTRMSSEAASLTPSFGKMVTSGVSPRHSWT